MIQTLDCAYDRHLGCSRWFAPEYLCQCQCHDPAIAERLYDAVEADEEVPMDELWRIVLEGLEALEAAALEASVTSVT